MLRPDPTVRCSGWPNCEQTMGLPLGQAGGARIAHIKYPVGRWHILDKQVKNGFVYFYAVTAYDSTGPSSSYESRSVAVEADGVVPQAGVDTVSSGSHVWVVPNPYRGGPLRSRPSSWDLTPNASDSSAATWPR